MSNRLKDKSERLLDEPGESPAGGAADPLRARLAATLAEGLDGPPVTSADSDSFDTAAVAAFIDGNLAGAEREDMVARLGRQANRRADLQSASELIQSVGQ